MDASMAWSVSECFFVFYLQRHTLFFKSSRKSYVGSNFELVLTNPSFQTIFGHHADFVNYPGKSSKFLWFFLIHVCLGLWGVILSLGIFFYVFFILNYLLPLLVNKEYGCYVWFHWQKAYKMTVSLVYQSFGVVYGDLITSPIYVFTNTFSGRLRLHESDDDIVLGVLSLVFWTWTIIPLC